MDIGIDIDVDMVMCEPVGGQDVPHNHRWGPDNRTLHPYIVALWKTVCLLRPEIRVQEGVVNQFGKEVCLLLVKGVTFPLRLDLIGRELALLGSPPRINS
jgi:hypothetical protein